MDPAPSVIKEWEGSLGLLAFARGPAADRLREDFTREAYPHFREIYRAALRLTRRPAEAEDLTQEVFLQAWKSFDRFQLGTNARAWLYKILWNVHQQRLRKKVPIPLGAEGEERLAETLAAQETTPTEVKDEDVAAALEALSPEHREIVLLSDLEEFTYKEIAEILKIPIGTVMSRLSRARAALRERLSGVAERAGIAKGEAR
jgi:RNA polymerase sigma-70 factor (ECF subfamily)